MNWNRCPTASESAFGRAVNIPLGESREILPRQVKDKSQVLLLHCLSGGYSGIAKHQIKGLGYQKVFNLGSYRALSKLWKQRGIADYQPAAGAAPITDAANLDQRS